MAGGSDDLSETYSKSTTLAIEVVPRMIGALIDVPVLSN